MRHPLVRWATAAAGAVVLLVGAGSAASAEQPGANGFQAYDAHTGGQPVWRCLDDPAHTVQFTAGGGMAFSRDGLHEAAVVENPYPQQKGVNGVGLEVDTTTSPCKDPTYIGRVQEGSTPSYSPDGTKLAIVRTSNTDAADEQQIWVVDATTGKDLLHVANDATDPSWSPDGKTIAYSAPDGIRVRPATGGASTLLVSTSTGLTSGLGTEVDYSPDGTKLAFIVPGFHIAYVDAATGKNLVKTKIVGAAPFTWSPDGKDFYYGSDTASASQECDTATLAGKIISRQLGNDTDCTVLGRAPKPVS